AGPADGSDQLRLRRAHLRVKHSFGICLGLLLTLLQLRRRLVHLLLRPALLRPFTVQPIHRPVLRASLPALLLRPVLLRLRPVLQSVLLRPVLLRAELLSAVRLPPSVLRVPRRLLLRPVSQLQPSVHALSFPGVRRSLGGI